MGGATTICDLRDRPISLSRSNWSWKKNGCGAEVRVFSWVEFWVERSPADNSYIKQDEYLFFESAFRIILLKDAISVETSSRNVFKPHTSTQNPNKHTLFKHPTSSEGKSILIIFPNSDVGLYFCQIPCIFFTCVSRQKLLKYLADIFLAKKNSCWRR